MSEPDFVGLFEELSKAENTAELTEGRMLRFLLRKVKPHVSRAEFEILMFIFDRTYTYGKTSEAITTKHFLEGVIWGDVLLHPPIALKRTQLFDSLKRLCDNVILIRKTDRRTNRTMYMLNPLWDQNFVVPRNVTSRNVTKELVRYSGQGSPAQRTSLSGPANTIEQEDSNMGIRTGAAVPQSVTDLLNNSLGKSKDARDRKKQKGNATAFSKIWEDAFRSAYPEEQYFAWRVTELASFKRALQRGAVPPTVAPAFIDFVVTEFPSVVSAHFAWMQKPPTIPNVLFVVKHIEKFYTAFRDKDDPNRKIRGRIQRAETPVVPAAGHDELKKLQQKLDAALAAQERAEREANSLKADAAQVSRKKIKQLVRKRPTSHPDAGSWD